MKVANLCLDKERQSHNILTTCGKLREALNGGKNDFHLFHVESNWEESDVLGSREGGPEEGGFRVQIKQKMRGSPRVQRGRPK